MWGNQSQAMDVKSFWAAEESKTLEERRAGRNRRITSVTTADDIKPWSVHSEQLPKFKNIHSFVPPQVERPPNALFHLKSADGSYGMFYISRSTPEISKLEEQNAKITQEYLASLPKVDSPFTPNATLNRKVAVWRGNITTLEIDAIVNAANTSLLGGGGVDGAIHSAAGDTLYDECLTLNGGKTGHTKITRGHKLPARFVLHTVGPVGENPPALTSCYQTCLNFIDGTEKMPYPAKPIRTIAFCGVSTGIYGYPLVAASKVALETTRKWLEVHHDKVDLIIFCTFLDKEWDCYEQLMQHYFPPAPDAEFVAKWKEAHPSLKKQEDSDDSDSDTE